ncbi:hypothetical protein DXG03_004975 [Asterophora parasitica]|uniref:Uncharacterized protein n=1 Tax=Asterophora parasitica TaxID=117018 RepID=A0A9P7KDT9_9AGAR|nr:hypothetical protein DXG03_004975 [Asterophora parasitica]
MQVSDDPSSRKRKAPADGLPAKRSHKKKKRSNGNSISSTHSQKRKRSPTKRALGQLLIACLTEAQELTTKSPAGPAEVINLCSDEDEAPTFSTPANSKLQPAASTPRARSRPRTKSAIQAPSTSRSSSGPGTASSSRQKQKQKAVFADDTPSASNSGDELPAVLVKPRGARRSSRPTLVPPTETEPAAEHDELEAPIVPTAAEKQEDEEDEDADAPQLPNGPATPTVTSPDIEPHPDADLQDAIRQSFELNQDGTTHEDGEELQQALYASLSGNGCTSHEMTTANGATGQEEDERETSGASSSDEGRTEMLNLTHAQPSNLSLAPTSPLSHSQAPASTASTDTQKPGLHGSPVTDVYPLLPEPDEDEGSELQDADLISTLGPLPPTTDLARSGAVSSSSDASNHDALHPPSPAPAFNSPDNLSAAYDQEEQDVEDAILLSVLHASMMDNNAPPSPPTEPVESAELPAQPDLVQEKEQKEDSQEGQVDLVVQSSSEAPSESSSVEPASAPPERALVYEPDPPLEHNSDEAILQSVLDASMNDISPSPAPAAPEECPESQNDEELDKAPQNTLAAPTRSHSPPPTDSIPANPMLLSPAPLELDTATTPPYDPFAAYDQEQRELDEAIRLSQLDASTDNVPPFSPPTEPVVPFSPSPGEPQPAEGEQEPQDIANPIQESPATGGSDIRPSTPTPLYDAFVAAYEQEQCDIDAAIAQSLLEVPRTDELPGAEADQPPPEVDVSSGVRIEKEMTPPATAKATGSGEDMQAAAVDESEEQDTTNPAASTRSGSFLAVEDSPSNTVTSSDVYVPGRLTQRLFARSFLPSKPRVPSAAVVPPPERPDDAVNPPSELENISIAPQLAAQDAEEAASVSFDISNQMSASQDDVMSKEVTMEEIERDPRLAEALDESKRLMELLEMMPEATDPAVDADDAENSSQLQSQTLELDDLQPASPLAQSEESRDYDTDAAGDTHPQQPQTPPADSEPPAATSTATALIRTDTDILEPTEVPLHSDAHIDLETSVYLSSAPTLILDSAGAPHQQPQTPPPQPGIFQPASSSESSIATMDDSPPPTTPISAPPDNSHLYIPSLSLDDDDDLPLEVSSKFNFLDIPVLPPPEDDEDYLLSHELIYPNLDITG